MRYLMNAINIVVIRLLNWWFMLRVEQMLLMDELDNSQYGACDRHLNKEKVRAHLIDIFEKTGFYKSRSTQLNRDLEEYLGLNESDFSELPKIFAGGLIFETDLILNELINCCPSLTLIFEQRYDESGRVAPAQSERLNERQVPRSFGVLLKFNDLPLYVFLTRSNSINPYEWRMNVTGENGNEFLELLEKTIDDFLLKKCKGKIINSNLEEIELKVFNRDRLVYPEPLSGRIDDLVSAFVGWLKGDQVMHWGCCLIGSPGTGKTTIGGLIAGLKEDATFIYWPASEIKHPNDINRIFRLAKTFSPSIIMIDDVDFIAKNRNSGIGSDLTSTFMENLDGLKEDSKIYVILTSNDVSGMDPAIIYRAGRISDRVELTGFRDCMVELISAQSETLGLKFSDDDVIASAVKGFLSQAGDSFIGFTPDEIKNVCQRGSLLFNGQEISSMQLKGILDIVYEAFHSSRSIQSSIPDED
jgi:hypothetical protein